MGSIARLGLVQTALGAIVVLMTSTINRVMVVELALPALVPGLLVASHYAVQILRPAWGYGSDVGGRRTPWIVGGMAALALGGVGAALGTALAADSRPLGISLSALSFLLVGVGVGAAGTSVLAMLATRVAPHRRAAAASAVWMMMILGFAISAPLAGHFLDPFSNGRLIAVTATVSAIAFLVATLAVWGVEGRVAAKPRPAAGAAPANGRFLDCVWEKSGRSPAARRFTIFIFVSMLAYGAQELLIEPFAGLVFGMTPGSTTKLAGLQHGGVLTGMLGVAVAASAIGGPILGSLRLWTIGRLRGLRIVAGGDRRERLLSSDPSLFRAAVFALGVSNGVFAVAAIGSMMGLAGRRRGVARRHPDGAVGRGAGHRVRARRRHRDGLRRRRARAFSATPLVAYALRLRGSRRRCSCVAAALASAVARDRASRERRPRDERASARFRRDLERAQPP